MDMMMTLRCGRKVKDYLRSITQRCLYRLIMTWIPGTQQYATCLFYNGIEIPSGRILPPYLNHGMLILLEKGIYGIGTSV